MTAIELTNGKVIQSYQTKHYKPNIPTPTYQIKPNANSLICWVLENNSLTVIDLTIGKGIQLPDFHDIFVFAVENPS